MFTQSSGVLRAVSSRSVYAWGMKPAHLTVVVLTACAIVSPFVHAQESAQVFTAPVFIGTGLDSFRLAFDMNGDGDQDALSVWFQGFGGMTVSGWRNDGSGKLVPGWTTNSLPLVFNPPPNLGTIIPAHFAKGDFNADGSDDFVFALEKQVGWWISNGDSVAPAVPWAVQLPGQSPRPRRRRLHRGRPFRRGDPPPGRGADLRDAAGRGPVAARLVPVHASRRDSGRRARADRRRRTGPRDPAAPIGIGRDPPRRGRRDPAGHRIRVRAGVYRDARGRRRRRRRRRGPRRQHERELRADCHLRSPSHGPRNLQSRSRASGAASVAEPASEGRPLRRRRGRRPRSRLRFRDCRDLRHRGPDGESARGLRVPPAQRRRGRLRRVGKLAVVRRDRGLRSRGPRR